MSSSPRYVLDRTPPPPVVAPTLDPSQQQVVDHRGGPLLVLAGPGTGKTTTLVEAVVDRVERDGLSPEQVLVLTFSRKAADELRERITGRLGRTVAEPAAFTFHAWCYALVRAYDVAPGAEPPRLLSGAERDVRVHDLLKGNADGVGTRWPPAVLPALRLRGFAREVADLLDRARERGLGATELRALGSKLDRPEWVSGGDFLTEYLTVLASRGELDYAGLVARALDLLDDPEVVAEVAARYRVVFVDEYQDTDPAQERLLARLTGPGGELVAVGDPDQSIYAFRGAEVRNILQFPDRFHTRAGGPAPTLALRRSRRAGADLLAASRKIAERIGSHGPVSHYLREHRDLEPAADHPSAAPEVRLFPTVAEEVTAIADLLRRAHLEDGRAWRDMAVLVRSGVRSIPVLRRAFVTAGVPVSVAADEVVLARDPAVQPLLVALDVAHRGWAALDDDPDTASALLLSPLGRAHSGGLRALGRRLRAQMRAAGVAVPPSSAVMVRQALADPRDLTLVEDWVADPVVRLHALLARAIQEAAAGGTPEEVLWTLWEGSGWGRRLAGQIGQGGDAAHSADRDLDAALALFEAAGRLEDRRPHAGVGALLDEVRAQQIPAAPMEERPGAADAVRLLTAHRSKGLEWDLVVVAGVQDGVWPDLRRRGSLLAADLVDDVGSFPREAPSASALLAEERRLFYVACTRARQRLLVTAVSSVDESGERPSRFVEELGVDVPEGAEHAGTELLAVDSLVARLRRAAQDGSTAAEVRRAAAGELALLAAARDEAGVALVPHADPDRWWGLRELTPGAQPVREPAQPVTLSASGVAGFEQCPLRWFLDREVHAKGASSTAQSFGSVVHALAQAVAEGALPADVSALTAALDTVWDRLGFEARWQAERDRRDAQAVLTRFLVWHAESQREVVATEQSFDVELGDIRLHGAVDRLEIDVEGRLHVVDLKTGKQQPTDTSMGTEPQLGVYQLAARAGAFTDVPAIGADVTLGGAELVQLRRALKGDRPKVQVQPALPAEACWADELVARVAAGIRAEDFPARPEQAVCDRCAFRGCCPSHEAGRQVLPWPR